MVTWPSPPEMPSSDDCHSIYSHLFRCLECPKHLPAPVSPTLVPACHTAPRLFLHPALLSPLGLYFLRAAFSPLCLGLWCPSQPVSPSCHLPWFELTSLFESLFVLLPVASSRQRPPVWVATGPPPLSAAWHSICSMEMHNKHIGLNGQINM